jgi:hypothetical protein
MLREPSREPAKEHDGAFEIQAIFCNLNCSVDKTMIVDRWKTTNGKSGSVEIKENSVWREVWA